MEAKRTRKKIFSQEDIDAWMEDVHDRIDRLEARVAAAERQVPKGPDVPFVRAAVLKAKGKKW